MNQTEDIYRQWSERRFALDQSTHEAINASHYPGTRQMCCRCDEPTGRCEEDSMFIGDDGPYCEACMSELGGYDECPAPPSHGAESDE
jgi:hypothetical protein